MGWTVWADPWPAGALSDASMFQTVRMNRDIILRAARTWVVVFGDPVFTDLSMRIYSNEVVAGANTPRKLLHTSTDVRAKAEVHTLAYGVKEIYFTFDDVPLVGADRYNFVVNGTGYVPTADSYLAWRKAFPDPVYGTGSTPTIARLSAAPYELSFIGSDF